MRGRRGRGLQWLPSRRPTGGGRSRLLSEQLIAFGVGGIPGRGQRVEALQGQRALAAAEQDFHIQHLTVECLLGRQRRLSHGESPCRIVRPSGGDPRMSRLQCISRAVGAAVLLGQLLIHARCAGQVALLPEILSAVDRWGQLAARAEARATGQGQCRQQHRTMSDPPCGGHRSAR